MRDTKYFYQNQVDGEIKLIDKIRTVFSHSGYSRKTKSLFSQLCHSRRAKEEKMERMGV